MTKVGWTAFSVDITYDIESYIFIALDKNCSDNENVVGTFKRINNL